MERRDVGKVEGLLRQVENFPIGQSTFDLWVPQTLTLKEHPIDRATAMAILLDSILQRGLFPDGFTEGAGGRTYHYIAGE